MTWNLIKNRAIKKYHMVLPEVLAEDYLRSDFYTTGQVKSAIKNHNLSSKYEPYAVVLFTSFEDTESVFQSEYPGLNGYKIRAQVADLLFDGNMHYAVVTRPLKLAEYGNIGISTSPDSGE